MFFLHTGVNDNIIQVHKTCGVVKLSETVLHQPLKGRWGITEPEWHRFTLIEPQHTPVKAAYCLDPSAIGVCQNPDSRSTVV